MKHVPASVRQTAFNCPHCRVLTTQYWHSLLANKINRDPPLPLVLAPEYRKRANLDATEDSEERKKIDKWLDMMVKGEPFLRDIQLRGYSGRELCNVHLAQCFNCKNLSIWVYDRLVHPRTGEAQSANPDLPKDIRRDYDEASTILDLSPRGAAALLRLAIQKLCKELGQPGKNINDDIAALVAAGLDPRIQKALDAVRVIGNNAVHPGQVDLRDDRTTAEMLFGLVNVIAEKTISVPKHIDEVYSTLPDAAQDAIAKRDANK